MGIEDSQTNIAFGIRSLLHTVTVYIRVRKGLDLAARFYRYLCLTFNPNRIIITITFQDILLHPFVYIIISIFLVVTLKLITSINTGINVKTFQDAGFCHV